MTNRVLLVDDDREVRDALAQSLMIADIDAVACGSFIEAKDHISRSFDGVIVTDIRMPGRDGFHLLEYALGIDAELPVILLTGEADVPMALRAISAGAFTFLEKPCAPADLIKQVKQALSQRVEVLAQRRQLSAMERGDAAARMLRGTSPQSEKLRQRVRAVAGTTAEVLVTGEPGSGTPKVAEIIHLLSPISKQPFIKRSGGALDIAGLQHAFEQSKGGSLFIDEVGALPSSVQFALNDALENGVETRILAGTTKPLDRQVARGEFAADLYYRLDLMRVVISPLRERPEDIPVLFRHYVAQACEQAALPVPEITADVLAGLMAQDWPGNARSLTSAAMRFALGVHEAPTSQELGLVEQLASIEKSLLVTALRRHGGRATATAEALKLPRKTFYDKLGKYRLKAEDYRD